MSIESELERLVTAKNNLKASINLKGGNLTTETLSDYAAAVDAIQTAKPEQEKTVDVNFSSGNQTVSPDSGKVLSKVTINKPSTLTQENIANGVNIGGVTGTLVSGATVKTLTVTGGGSTSLSFAAEKQPKAFWVRCQSSVTLSTTRVVQSVYYDGSAMRGQYSYQSTKNSWGSVYDNASYFSHTYSNGTVTVKTSSTSNGGVFKSATTYHIMYVY